MKTGITIIICAWLTWCSFADGVRFCFLADTHFGITNPLRGVKMSNDLVYIATNFQPQFVLSCGDCADKGGVASQMIELTNAMGTAFQSRGIPHWEAFGNHDGANIDYSDIAIGLSNWVVFIGHTNFVYTNANWRFIGLGSLAENTDSAGGQISTGMLNFLETSLSNTPRDFVNVVLTHHPVDGTDFGEYAPGYPWTMITGLNRFTNLMASYKVPLFFHGHTHFESNYSRLINGRTLQVCVPSLAYTWPLGGGQGTNGWGAFNIVTITNRQMITRQYKASVANGYPLIGSYTNWVPYYGFGTKANVARVGTVRGP